jgi:hypothetical protein
MTPDDQLELCRQASLRWQAHGVSFRAGMQQPGTPDASCLRISKSKWSSREIVQRTRARLLGSTQQWDVDPAGPGPWTEDPENSEVDKAKSARIADAMVNRER